MEEKCNHVDDANFAQLRVMFGHTDESGLMGFSKEYAPMMRAVYCGFICKDRYGCKAAKKHLPEDDGSDLEIKIDSGIHCDHAEGLRSITKQVIRKHLDRHKWFRHIKDRKTAIDDFMKNYEFIIDEMYCENACPSREVCSTSINLKDKSETRILKNISQNILCSSESKSVHHAY